MLNDEVLLYSAFVLAFDDLMFILGKFLIEGAFGLSSESI